MIMQLVKSWYGEKQILTYEELKVLVESTGLKY